MSYLDVFEISASGMDLQMARVETIALNLANAKVAGTSSQNVYRPKEVLANTKFEQALDATSSKISGVSYKIVDSTKDARLVFEPSHPYADTDGFVAYPDINPITEMTKLVSATRSYEANAQVLNASKTMASVAMDIGRGR